MFLKRRLLQNIFSDRSSLVLRALLRELGREWKVSDLANEGVSFGLVSIVLNRAESLGYVERVRIGPGSYTKLINSAQLLNDWSNHYSFDRNLHTYYHCSDKNFLKACKDYCKANKIEYALTLFSGSRLIAPYVKDNRHFIYFKVNATKSERLFRDIKSALGLLKLARGGNVCFAIPFYQSSVFRDSRIVKGYSVVSNLQLYLDLMGFPPSGQEEAHYLKAQLTKKGELLA